jgi:high frequency lysogenization protein
VLKNQHLSRNGVPSLTHSTEDQVIALAAVFQSASLVDRLAKTGSVPEEPFQVLMESILKTDVDSTMEIYGDRFSLQPGLRDLTAVLDKKNDRSKVEIVRYSLTLLFLEGKLNKRTDMLSFMSQRITQIQAQTRHFEIIHPTIIGAFASLYKDTISTFPQRIQVTGESKFLRIDENAEKIRALLLAGIRAAVLWRQVGGRRWKLLFMRRSILRAAKKMIC